MEDGWKDMLGFSDGCDEGFADKLGDSLGCDVGISEGCPLGWNDGFEDILGWSDMILGCWEGFDDMLLG